MKYFETQEPYYALIVAENEEKAKELYEEIVSDIDDEEEFYSNSKEVRKEYAKEQFKNALDVDGDKPDIEDFDKFKNELLLIDRSLI